MQALSQAAAPTEPPSAPVPGLNPLLKAPEVPVAAGEAIPQARRAEPIPERHANPPEQRRADHPEERPANPPGRRADHPEERPANPPGRRADHPQERRANPPERRAGNLAGSPPGNPAGSLPGNPAGGPAGHSAIGAPTAPVAERTSERRPTMSSLRFAILLGVVAVGSAIGTAVTYLATTGELRFGHVATSVTSREPVVPAAAVAPNAAAASIAPAATIAPRAAAHATAPAAAIAPVATPLATAPAAAVTPAAAPPPPSAAPPPTNSAPLRFANPFDRKEVFEFPPGTSRAAARDAVAELLYERAQDRRVSAGDLVSGPSARHSTSSSTAAAPVARRPPP